MGNITVKPHLSHIRSLKKATEHTFISIRMTKLASKCAKGVLKTTITAALHHFLGLGMRRHEEKHAEDIRELKERDRFRALVIVKFIQKYGTHAIKGQ